MQLPELTLHTADVKIPGRVLASCLSGSWLYGIHTETSDLDWKYVYVVPNKTLLGLYPPHENKLTREGKIENLDSLGTLYEWVAHEVGKFARLLLKGNPTMIEMISYPKYDPALEEGHPLWTELRKKAPEFMTQRTVGQYLGYINGQMQRLRKGMKLHTGNKGEYNTKWAYHMVRLAWDLIEIIEGRLPAVCHLEEKRELLKDIRANNYTEDEIIEMVLTLITQVELRKPWDNLPEEGPSAWMNDWLLRVRAELGELG